jgi:hypothetical protein
MDRLVRKVAAALIAGVLTAGFATPAMAEKPGTNDRPCHGNSKHAGPQGGGACPHP